MSLFVRTEAEPEPYRSHGGAQLGLHDMRDHKGPLFFLHLRPTYYTWFWSHVGIRLPHLHAFTILHAAYVQVLFFSGLCVVGGSKTTAAGWKR